MNITPKPYTIAGLFPPDSKTYFKIPDFQRNYEWKQPNWETLFNDVLDNPVGYFLGSIVSITKQIDIPNSILQSEIIDGQQRITTISILFIAIHKRIDELLSETSDELVKEEQSSIINQIKDRLTILRKKQIKLIPLEEKNNRNDYYNLLNKHGIFKQEINVKNSGNRKIERAYKYFYNRLKNMSYNEVRSFYERLCDCTVITIEVDTLTNAFIIFETLNFRGAPLTIVDLLKVIYFKTAAKEDCPEKKWKNFLEIFEYSGDNDVYIIRQFLINNYLAFINDYRKLDNTFPLKITNNSAVGQYEKLFNLNGANYMDSLIENAKLFNRIVKVADDKDPFYEELKTLSRLNITQSYMFIMMLFEKQEKLNLSNDQIKQILCKIISFFVRRNLTNIPQARDVNSLFSSLANDNELFSKESSDAINYIIDRIDDKKAKDEVVLLSLNEGIYDKDYGLTRIILSTYENRKRNKETIIDFEKTDVNNKPIWTVEHILPTTKNLKNEWILDLSEAKEVNEETKRKALNIQSKVVHKLGNLTLSGYNSYLSDLPFLQKRDHVDSKNNYNGFKNGLNLNRRMKNKSKWNEKEINSRNKILSHFVIRYYK